MDLEWTGCDAKDCPARAQVIAHIPVEGVHDAVLAFCMHHYGKYRVRLTEAATWIEEPLEPAK